jgi:hypothetical protein
MGRTGGTRETGDMEAPSCAHIHAVRPGVPWPTVRQKYCYRERLRLHSNTPVPPYTPWPPGTNPSSSNWCQLRRPGHLQPWPAMHSHTSGSDEFVATHNHRPSRWRGRMVSGQWCEWPERGIAPGHSWCQQTDLTTGNLVTDGSTLACSDLRRKNGGFATWSLRQPCVHFGQKWRTRTQGIAVPHGRTSDTLRPSSAVGTAASVTAWTRSHATTYSIRQHPTPTRGVVPVVIAK